MYIITICIIILEVKAMKEYIREKLKTMGEEKYSKFSSALVPGAENMLGVRLPELRKYAKTLASDEGVKALEGGDVYFEETMLRGMVIGYLKISPEERLELVKEFVPRIDNWSICDSFVCTMKFPKKAMPAVWDFLQPYIHSGKEFEQRFAAVMMLNKFVNDEYIDRVLSAYREINTDAYYSSMGVAWGIAECFIKFPEKTRPLIEGKCFDPQTHNKAIGKICDSFRVSAEEKTYLRQIKL